MAKTDRILINTKAPDGSPIEITTQDFRDFYISPDVIHNVFGDNIDLSYNLDFDYERDKVVLSGSIDGSTAMHTRLMDPVEAAKVLEEYALIKDYDDMATVPYFKKRIDAIKNNLLEDNYKKDHMVFSTLKLDGLGFIKADGVIAATTDKVEFSEYQENDSYRRYPAIILSLCVGNVEEAKDVEFVFYDFNNQIVFVVPNVRILKVERSKKNSYLQYTLDMANKDDNEYTAVIPYTVSDLSKASDVPTDYKPFKLYKDEATFIVDRTKYFATRQEEEDLDFLFDD